MSCDSAMGFVSDVCRFLLETLEFSCGLLVYGHSVLLLVVLHRWDLDFAAIESFTENRMVVFLIFSRNVILIVKKDLW